MGQESMARVTHAAQIDLRFGDPAGEFLDFAIGVCPGNFAHERFHLFGQGWIGVNGQANCGSPSSVNRGAADVMDLDFDWVFGCKRTFLCRPLDSDFWRSRYSQISLMNYKLQG